MAKKCENCEHFKIIQPPHNGLDWGIAECKKHNMDVPFLNYGKIKKLKCVESESVDLSC